MPIALSCQYAFDKTLDSKTTGSHKYTRYIGKKLENCEKYPARDFDASETKMSRLSDNTMDQLSCDQKYLCEAVKALKTDYVSVRLANLYPLKISFKKIF